MHIPVVAIASIAVATAMPTAAAANPAMTIRLDRVVERAIADKRLVGTVVMVVRDGEVIYHRAAGFADRETGLPMREDTLFRLASISKPIVSVTFMRLVEDKRVSLDDPVTKWLPDFRPRLPDGEAPIITLRQLLTHTSGLSYGFLEPKGSAYHQLNVSDGLDQPGLPLDENLHRLGQALLAFPPGKGWRYSLGIDVLGAVIAKATGKSLPDAVDAAVTAPLGLHDTAFAVTDPSRLAVPYADGKPEPVRMTDGLFVPLGDGGARFAPSRALDPDSYPSGGAGMVGTAGDIARFLEAIRTGDGGILKPQTVAEMMRDQVGPQAQTQGPGWGFGYGWAVLDDPQARTRRSPGARSSGAALMAIAGSSIRPAS